MTELLVAVEDLEPGSTLILPKGQRVTVERVDEYDDQFVVRWYRRAQRGEPGFARPDDELAGDGRYFGSLVPVPVGHEWTVDG